MQVTEAVMLTVSPLTDALNVVGYVTAPPSCMVSATTASASFVR